MFSLVAQNDTILYENEFYEISDSIEVFNKSFEEISNEDEISNLSRIVPRHWLNCGFIEFPYESPVTIHKRGKENQFNIRHEPVHGNAFISMVTRENESFERISQELSYKLEKDTLYTMGFYVANALSMESFIRTDLETIRKFNNPVRLVLWCGDDFCSESDELFVTDDLLDEEWRFVQAFFRPKYDCEKLTIEVYYPSGFEYTNGNLLLDNLTNIYILNKSKRGH